MIKEDEKFYEEINTIFKNSLDYIEIDVIRIKDKNSGVVLKDIDYKRVFFDSDLNIYKTDINTGQILKVQNDNFEAVVNKKPVFLEPKDLPF